MKGKKWKSDYRKLKKTITEYVFENAALCDQVHQVQDNIASLKEQRRFLLKKLLEYDKSFDYNNGFSTETKSTLVTQDSVPNKSAKKSNIDDILKKNCANIVVATNAIDLSINTNSDTIYPLVFENLTVHSIGNIVKDNQNFHSDKWIYPVGFVSSRIFAHPKEPNRKCTFTCKILDNGGFPQFQIIPENDFDQVFYGDSANFCHMRLLDTIIRVCDIKTLPMQPQGEAFMGLQHPTIMSLLQELNGARACPTFRGFNISESIDAEKESNNPCINYDALQKLISISAYHTVPEIKEEPPDELLE